MSALVLGIAVLALAPLDLRFVRVAQREHYLPGEVSRFALRWWSLGPAGLLCALAALVGIGVGLVELPVGLLAAAALAVGPPGLHLRGRTGPLAWTRRLRVLAATLVALEGTPIALVATLVSLRAGALAALVAGLLAPAVTDAALALLGPIEGRLAGRYVARAAARLSSVAPRVVAITGSYGKTSTKEYLATLIGQRFATVASPRSFNNRAGLARTVNERVVPGTEVLIAEMGTYGPGEIAAMCVWMPPEIAIITAIGPVHLERFGTLEVTLASKAEICEAARAVCLNVDDTRLAGLAVELEALGKTVRRCSAVDPRASVAVVEAAGGLELFVDGVRHGALQLHPEVFVAPTNLACAIAAALELGAGITEVCKQAPRIGAVASRLVASRSPSGVVVLDDTFNSNPAGARRALAALGELGEPSARRVVVTPGMIELGPLQAEENGRFARAVLEHGGELVVVGRTNRRALLDGARSQDRTSARTHVVRDRNAAVDWVRAQLAEGDAVLYENDLPDHYP